MRKVVEILLEEAYQVRSAKQVPSAIGAGGSSSETALCR